MDLFDKLHEQIDTVRLPLFAVTVTAAAHINTPLIVLLGLARISACNTLGVARR